MIRINPHNAKGPIKPLHGVNLGPMDFNGILDHTKHFKRAAIPSVRLHDCNYSMLDVADLHSIFPNPKADADDPANYYFTQTDDYLKATRAAGADIYFRLGETIEQQLHKKYVCPEWWPSPEQIGRVCGNIVRHYNQGWADGFQWGIKYWEFWNEPQQGPVQPMIHPCWTGTPQQLMAFYRAVAAEVKQADPSVKIGLFGFSNPNFAYTDEEMNGSPPSAYRQVLKDAAAEGLPIDFVSWHRYTDRVEVIAEDARRVRRFLDEIGLKQAESHLTEWAWLPRTSEGLTIFHARRDKNVEQTEKAMERMSSAASAAFIFGTLARLQDLPIEQAHYYSTSSVHMFGLFRPSGMAKKSFTGLEVFAEFLHGRRIEVELDDIEGLEALAVQEGGKIKLGLAHWSGVQKEATIHLAADAPSRPSVRQYTDAGWKDIQVQAGATFSVPLAEAGMTIIQWP